ncbi:hypothetical protein GCM10010988_21890 [Cnuibacter physcomitrellae]|uniref:Uncharacterized protein n=1 Tax=Cnuibacter physcomitrellae TaxID=1619308 RepID=A0A1X9LXR9_9MICO|nr:hypothetical protein [Cnuibacter physcomitrellae]ARJ06860.1 hypothetical protein B5808_17745 [Cnuibacter physcomitrellae]GGI39002.1 hypothetical protein GCM10010988_21890 [Cnuibacter physcomitrellae]
MKTSPTGARRRRLKLIAVAVWLGLGVTAAVVALILGHPVWLLLIALLVMGPYLALASGTRQWTNTPQGFRAWLDR